MSGALFLGVAAEIEVAAFDKADIRLEVMVDLIGLGWYWLVPTSQK